MKTAKKPRNVDVSVKLHFKKNGEHIEKILRDAVVQYIRMEAVKNEWPQNSGGITCIPK